MTTENRPSSQPAGLPSPGTRPVTAGSASAAVPREAAGSDLLACPDCGTPLLADPDKWSCPGCRTSGPIMDGSPHFVDEFPCSGGLSPQEMQHVNYMAASVGWQKALAESTSTDVQRLAKSAMNTGTANWQWLLRLPPASRVLDVGAGMGADSHGLALQYREIIALEPDLERVRFLQHRFTEEGLTNIKIVRTSATRLPFAADSFDLIMMKGPIERVAADGRGDRHVLSDIICGLWRVLRPGGFFCLGVDNRFAITRLLGRMRRGKIEKGPQYLCSPRGYLKLLTEAGFTAPQCYSALPSYDEPRFLVPFNRRVYSYYVRNSTPMRQAGIRRLAQELLLRSGILQHLEQSLLFVAHKSQEE